MNHDSEWPSVDDLVGIDPDFAGGLSAEDYVASQRGPRPAPRSPEPRRRVDGLVWVAFAVGLAAGWRAVRRARR